jgi:transcriptional regulator with PAS, ATPase and Fis domain
MNNSEMKEKNAAVLDAPEAWGEERRVAFRWVEPVRDLSLRSFRNEAEIQAIHYALGKTGWNRKRAAKLLSISYRSLLYKIRRHNITPTAEQS